MGQKQTNKQNRKEKSFSKELVKSIANKPFTAEHWQRCTNSFPKNKRHQRTRTAIAVAIGVVIGALLMHFLSSPERWIRLSFVNLPKITTHYEYRRTYQPLCVVCNNHQ